MKKIYFPPVTINAVYLADSTYTGTSSVDVLARVYDDREFTAEMRGRVLVFTHRQDGFTMEYAILAEHWFRTYRENRDYRRALDIIQRITDLRIRRIIRQVNR